MNIAEAVKRAIEEDKYITITDFLGSVKIKPTDGKELCIIIREDGSHPPKGGWQPTATQLMQEDWHVVD